MNNLTDADHLKLIAHVVEFRSSWKPAEIRYHCIGFWYKCTNEIKSRRQDVNYMSRWQYEIENESIGDLFRWYDVFPKPPKEPGVYLLEATISGGHPDYYGEADDFHYNGEWKKINWAKAALYILQEEDRHARETTKAADSH